MRERSCAKTWRGGNTVGLGCDWRGSGEIQVANGRGEQRVFYLGSLVA